MNMKAILMGAAAMVCAVTFGEGSLIENGRLNTRKSMRTTSKKMVAKKLADGDFLVNDNYKKNAKVYFCLFSASWCGPCRREMPRIAKIYADTLKNDSDVEFIHFSCDRTDDKALAWAKENDVRFPVVKPNGGNPLRLECNGIPHIFILKSDGTLLKEGHPASLFTEEKIEELLESL